MGSVLEILLFATLVTLGAMLIGSGFSAASVTKWWKHWSGRSRDSALLDPEVVDALDAKHDLERGLERTRQIVTEQTDPPQSSSGGNDSGDGGGGDGAGGD